jgi:hypothetical protein
MFHVHGRKFFLAPPRRPGGPYYIRFEPPSNGRSRIGAIHRSLRTTVVAAAKERAKLIIEQWEIAERLKSKSGYAKIGDIVERCRGDRSDQRSGPETRCGRSSRLRRLLDVLPSRSPECGN